MSNIIVLGAGMVGSAMAIDLVKDHQVTLTDVNKDGKTPAQVAWERSHIAVAKYLEKQAEA